MPIFCTCFWMQDFYCTVSTSYLSYWRTSGCIRSFFNHPKLHFYVLQCWSCAPLPCVADSRGLVSCWGPFPGPGGPSGGGRTVSLDMRQSSVWDTAEEVPPFPQPSALRKPITHHENKLADTKQHRVVHYSTWTNPQLMHAPRKWRRAVVKLSGNFPSLAFYMNPLKAFTCSPFPHTLPFCYRRGSDASEEVLFTATANKQRIVYETKTYLSNMTTPLLQNWLIPILPSSKLFPRDVLEKRRRTSVQKKFSGNFLLSVSRCRAVQMLLSI